MGNVCFHTRRRCQCITMQDVDWKDFSELWSWRLRTKKCRESRFATSAQAPTIILPSCALSSRSPLQCWTVCLASLLHKLPPRSFPDPIIGKALKLVDSCPRLSLEPSLSKFRKRDWYLFIGRWCSSATALYASWALLSPGLAIPSRRPSSLVHLGESFRLQAKVLPILPSEVTPYAWLTMKRMLVSFTGDSRMLS